jgi:transposase
MRTYSIEQFNKEYPSDGVCLDELFQNRYGQVKTCPKCGVMDTKFYRVKARKCYACMYCGFQLHPTSGTIFHKSETAMTKWFFAVYLFSNSKNGVSAKELERHLGVTYKTAWRMAKQIRLLIEQNQDLLSGTIEADETYYGGKHIRAAARSSKTPVLGLVERKGRAKAVVSHTASRKTAQNFTDSNVDVNSTIYSNESPIYHHVSRKRSHESINHAKREYARVRVSTNTIEGFWSQLKRSLDGTYHSVSPKYLQSYVNEFVHSYNYRSVPIYPLMVATAARPVR